MGEDGCPCTWNMYKILTISSDVLVLSCLVRCRLTLSFCRLRYCPSVSVDVMGQVDSVRKCQQVEETCAHVQLVSSPC